MANTHDMTEPTEPIESGPTHRYSAHRAAVIENRWQQVWAEKNAFHTLNPGDEGFDPTARRFYCLDMFPYPSGAGLHVGHPIGYIGTDIISRFRRMQGDNVLHPMGWDAFGLPAEQYAIATGVHPRETTTTAITTFRRQLQRFGFSCDWEAASFRSAINDLFVCEHRAKFGAPVDGLFIEVGQSMAINDVTLLSLRECGPWLALGDRPGPGEAPISVKRCFACFNSFYEFGDWAGSFDAVVVPR